ncbi:unnamed protein product [Pedinophyceae sp. YPF-701]|nr:unnamed protein product [Pedinophyceae sp. YPF-701]
MLSRWVPKGGADALMIGGDTKDLYYLPRDIGSATVVLQGGKESLWSQAGTQAQVPLRFRDRPADDLRCFPDASFDAVVLLSPLAKVGDPAACVREAARVLRPGAPLVVMQRLQAGGVQVVAGGGAIDQDALLGAVEGAGLEGVDWDVALESLDAHAVGVGRKGEGGGGQDVDSEALRTRRKKKRRGGGFK